MAAKKPIRIKPENKGKLRKKMGVKKGETISTTALAKKKAAAKKRGDSATMKQVTFAMNAKKWKKK